MLLKHGLRLRLNVRRRNVFRFGGGLVLALRLLDGAVADLAPVLEQRLADAAHRAVTDVEDAELGRQRAVAVVRVGGGGHAVVSGLSAGKVGVWMVGDA